MKKHEITVSGYFLTIYQDENKFFSIGLTSQYSSLEDCIQACITDEKKKEAEEDWEEEFEPEEDWDDYQDYDSGLTEREQFFSDRADWANERLSRGEIDEEQAAEIRMGA